LTMTPWIIDINFSFRPKQSKYLTTACLSNRFPLRLPSGAVSPLSSKAR
jgi:hypothetical protein